jgi:RNA polymerase sigma-70 factor (ECF subfamily)
MSQAQEIRKLVIEARNGNRDAFKTIYEIFGPRIYNFLYRLLGSRNEAEDVTQQTFLAVLHRLGSLRDPDLLESWIYRIARNEVYQKFRRKPVDSLDDEDSRPFAEKTEDPRLQGHPEKELLNEELRNVLSSVLQSIPLKLREVFILAVVEEMSYQEISKIVGRSLLSVKTDIYRARLMARDKLSRYTISGNRISVRKSDA